MNAKAALIEPAKQGWTGNYHQRGVYPRDGFKATGSLPQGGKSRNYVLYQSFSNMNVHTDHLGALSKHRF